MRIFSGIQPTGRKHLGNYIGAITQYVAGQDRGEAIYCVVDLHAITVAYEPVALRESVYDTAATLLAAGLEPERCIFFRQSDVFEHTELCWLLSSVTSFGDLNRMTQFKDKAGAQRDLVSAGLFIYPVLQAADVLAYRAHEVPVGEDQRQHIELMRDAAIRFNARFGETLVIPEARIPQVGARIMDLQAPERKMSTTGGTPQGTVLVLDEPATIAKKIRSSVTDSGSEVVRSPDKPGISNLIDILAAVRGVAPEEIEREFDGSGYGAFKQAVADAVVEYLTPVRERYNAIRADEDGLERILAQGADKARAIASDTLADVRVAMGVERSGRADNVCVVAVVDLELDLDVFAGPFDLLLTLILREEVDLLEVDLADVVITYIDHLERRGELDLEAATEFLVLIAALLELKSRLLLPGEEIEEIELDPGEAAEELLARLLAAHRYRAAAGYLRERLEDEQGHRFRSAPLPPQLRKAPLTDARAVYDPAALSRAIGDLLQIPPPVDIRHITVAKVTVAERLAHLRTLLRRGSFTFSEAVARSDRVTVAVTLYALLELYKQGEATWTQDEPFAEITIESKNGSASRLSA